ncbi:hypothetical protein HRbin30_01985 [bacterium HR30]|nr:hypothetical protein HRbin30_01985 [bacterium HR30]
MFPNPLSPARTPHNTRRGFVPLMINFFFDFIASAGPAFSNFPKKAEGMGGILAGSQKPANAETPAQGAHGGPSLVETTRYAAKA